MNEKLNIIEERIKKLEEENQKLKRDIKKLKKDNKILKNFFKWIFGGKIEKNEEDNSKAEEFKNENNKLKQEIKNLNSKLMQLEEEKNNLQTDLNKSKENNKNLQKENNELKEKLKKLDKKAKIQELYNQLSEESKKGMVLDEKNPYITGILNIKKIWKYAEYLNREHKDNDFSIVREIFYTLFDEFKGIYTYQDVKVGDEYDMDKFIRDNRSEGMNGKVEEVVLKGFLRDDEIIRKSIVKIK